MDAAARQELPKTADQFVATVVKGPWPAFKTGGAIDAAADAFLRGLYEDASDDELGDLSVGQCGALGLSPGVIVLAALALRTPMR